MAHPYDKFTWRPTSFNPHIWERDIDEIEQAYSHLMRVYKRTGRMFFAITGHVSLTISVSPEKTADEITGEMVQSLREAWFRLRYDCPTIASQILWDEGAQRLKKRYHCTAERQIWDDWLEQTFQVITENVSGVEWANSDPPAPDMPTLFVRTSHTRGTAREDVVKSDIVLRAPHDVIDGIGTLYLFNNLIAHAAEAFQNSSSDEPSFGTEWTNLSPPLRVAANIPSRLSSPQESHLAAITAKNCAVKSELDIATLPFRKGALLPGKHQRDALLLSESETAALLIACKSIGITVTHAFHAAIAQAIGDRQARGEEDRRMRYVSYILMNERHRCHYPYKSSRHAATVYHSLPATSLYVDLCIPGKHNHVATSRRRGEFMSILTCMRKIYASLRDDEESINFVPAVFSAVTPSWSGALEGSDYPSVPAPNAAPSVSISSMGLVDRIIAPEQGPFSIHDPWVTGEELGTGYGIFLATWRGRLELSGAYNEAWHSKDDMREFLEDCWHCVKLGLNLDTGRSEGNLSG